MLINNNKAAAQTMVAAGLSVWSFWLGELKDVLAPVFAQASSRNAAFDYVRGLLAVSERRSCWQLAELAGHLTPRRLQALLGEYRWDYLVLLARLRELVVAHLGEADACLALDETAEIKKGEATVGVAPQYAGITGQVERCQTVVFLAYVSTRAHVPLDFALYLPRKAWADDLPRRATAGVPEDVVFTTKPALGIELLRRAVAAAVPFAWVLADEVYGRASTLRSYLESIGRGYILTVPLDFLVILYPNSNAGTVEQAATTVPEDNWQARSCGQGCKGHRYYQWALLATACPYHWVLLRRHPTHPDQITYLYVFVPPQATITLAILVRIAGRRWPIEECFQQGKGQVGLDQHQVRTWRSFHRHTTLAMLALAIVAIATATPATDQAHTDQADTDQADTLLAPATTLKPEQWRDSAPLPHHPDQAPPEDPGLVAVSVPEGRRLLNLAASTLSTTAKLVGLHWSHWRRRHQARARWHHYRRHLRAALA